MPIGDNWFNAYLNNIFDIMTYILKTEILTDCATYRDIENTDIIDYLGKGINIMLCEKTLTQCAIRR